jgi:hypothetical protein
MRLACVIAGTLCLAAVACGDEPRGWTRVVAVEEGLIRFVHADRDADVCVAFSMGMPSRYTSPDPDVVVRGANYVVGTGWGTPYRSSCTNGSSGSSSYNDGNVSGKVVFDDFINFVDTAAPCTVSFDLSIVGEDDRVYEVSARDFPILDVGCPRPGVYRAQYSDLDAAYGQYDGSDMLVVSAWDDAREVCVWARFSNDAELPPSDVEIPDAWVYAGLRFGFVERDACVASNFIVPPVSPDYLSDSAPEMGSTGTVTFAETNTEGLPCTLDLDLDLRSQGRFDWTPDDVHMIADAVVVDGACD